MKILPIIQRSPEWHVLRKNKIGASMAPIIMGDSPYKTAYRLWEEMLGFAQSNIPNSAMQRGIDLEDIAREMFEARLGELFTPCVLQHDEYDWMIASLDGMSLDGKKIVEIKCGSKQEHEDVILGSIPKKYYAQIQHQLAVSGLNESYYFSFYKNQGATTVVKRDDKYIETLIEKEKEFWKSLDELKFPALTERDYVERNDYQWMDLSHKWLEINRQLKFLEEQEEKVREKLVTLSGGSNTRGSGLKLSKIIRKGNIDYGSIKELQSVDLEKHRKQQVTTYKICADTKS